MVVVIEVTEVGYSHCKECHRELKLTFRQLTGYCRRCYWELFPIPEIELPPLRRQVKGGWQRLVSMDEILAWQDWMDGIIDKVDRENSVTERAQELIN